MADHLEEDVYERLGVRKLINAEGTVTALGGCRMEPEVTDAMARASRHFVDLHELLIKSGAYVAELIGVEAALITAGAAAGLALATAACIAGDDPATVQRLPDAEGKPTRVAIHRCHRNGYDQAVRQVGAELVEFGWIKETYPWQLEAAIDRRTAAVAYFVEFSERGSLPLETVIEIAHHHGVPVIVDAAAELPPVHNLWRFTKAGADLTVFSGGKDIRGPQSSGLIVGRKDLIETCTRHACPNYSIGRAMKTGKEEIIGLVVALERYLSQDREAEDAQWEAQVAHLMQRLEMLPGVSARRAFPVGPGRRPGTIPRVYVEWDAATLDLTVQELVDKLYAGDPPIAVGRLDGVLVLNPQTLDWGEEQIVADRIVELLSSYVGTSDRTAP
jgi:L-seryl-tRNA(Ser) seleniumtransferase